MTLDSPRSRSRFRSPLLGGALIGFVYDILARAVAEKDGWIPFFGV